MARTTSDFSTPQSRQQEPMRASASPHASTTTSSASKSTLKTVGSAQRTPDLSELGNYVQVTDQFNHVHYCLLEQTLGKGGQGMVCKVYREPQYAIKLVQCEDPQSKQRVFIQNKDRVQAYNQQLQQILSFPIDPALHIALPVAYIRQYAGYVMPLLGEMTSLKALTVQGNLKTCSDLPVDSAFDGLYDQSNVNASNFFRFLSFYKSQGSLRLRLNVLKQLSLILAKLHAQDLVFGDLSPNNVLLTTRHAAHQMPQVWLIDIDNIRHMGQGTYNYTPGFTAPEVPAGSSTSIFSDCYAFALLAFKTLTTDSALDENYPTMPVWIYSEQATLRNFDANLHRLWLTSKLFALFDSTFSASLPGARPPMWQWFKALQQAEDLTLACPHCGLHHYASPKSLTNSLACPFCDHTIAWVVSAATLVLESPQPAHKTAEHGELSKVSEDASKEVAANLIQGSSEGQACPSSESSETTTTNAAQAQIASSVNGGDMESSGNIGVLPAHFVRELVPDIEVPLYRHLWEPTCSDQDECLCLITLDLPEHIKLQVQQPLNLQLALKSEPAIATLESEESMNSANVTDSSDATTSVPSLRFEPVTLLEKGSHRLSLNSFKLGFNLQLVANSSKNLMVKGVSTC